MSAACWKAISCAPMVVPEFRADRRNRRGIVEALSGTVIVDDDEGRRVRDGKCDHADQHERDGQQERAQPVAEGADRPHVRASRQTAISCHGTQAALQDAAS